MNLTSKIKTLFSKLKIKLKNKHFCEYLVFVTIFVSSLIPIIVLMVKLYTADMNTNTATLSTWIGILSNIAFGSLVSMIVQIINDNREITFKKHLKNDIRTREFSKLSNYINEFLSSFHDCETELVAEYSFMKDSLIDNNLDFEIITQNLCYADEINIKEQDSNKSIIIRNYLLDNNMRNQYNKMAKNILELCSNMNNINETYNDKIFSDDEIFNCATITCIETESSLDINSVIGYIRSIFKLVNNFNLTINVFANYMWAICALLLSSENEEVEDKKVLAKTAVENYFNDKNDA